MIIKIYFRFSIMLMILLKINSVYSQNNLKEYLINKVLINQVDKYSKDNNIEKTIENSSKILKSKDLTFHRETYNMISRLMFKNNDHINSLTYLDQAVKFGLWWKYIDTTLQKEYGYQRFLKNWAIYEKSHLNKEFVNLINKVSETDQGVRIKYGCKPITQKIWEEYKKVDSINYNLLANYIERNSWPTFLSYNDTTISYLGNHEDCPITSFISHFGRQKLLFFLDKAYNSASNGYSSWNLVFQLENFLLWKMPSRVTCIRHNQKKYIITASPLLRINICKETQELDEFNSMFEICSLAELAHPNSNLTAFVLPSVQYYTKNKEAAFQQLAKIYSKFTKLKVDKWKMAKINWTYYNKNIEFFKKYCNFNSPFFLVVIKENGLSFGCKTPYGFPTIIEYTKLTENDINSLYTN